MNKVNLADEDPAALQLSDIQSLSLDEIRQEFLNERQRCVILEKDLFKSQSEKRRLDAQIRTLQELNTLNAKNRNNTSSAFTLPSEFKSAWDELVKESILDAFPDFLDNYEELVPLVQELFMLLREEITQIQRSILIDIAKRLNLFGPKVDAQEQEQIIGHLETKFQAVFQEYSLKIFSLTDEQIDQFLEQKYKPKCEDIVSQRDGALDDFEDNISTPDFKRFVRHVLKLSLHMVLNDPPIQLSMDPWQSRKQREQLVEKFEFWMFNKNDYYCIDGFPKEGYPCIVVLPPPFRSGYVYQGIKPAVIVLNNPSDELMEHVRVKQEELLEKLKLKRQLSLCGNDEEARQAIDEAGLANNNVNQQVEQQDDQVENQIQEVQENDIVQTMEAQQSPRADDILEAVTMTPIKGLNFDTEVLDQFGFTYDAAEAKVLLTQQSAKSKKSGSKATTGKKNQSRMGTTNKKSTQSKVKTDSKLQEDSNLSRYLNQVQLSDAKSNSGQKYSCISPAKPMNLESSALKSRIQSTNKKESSNIKSQKQLSEVQFNGKQQSQSSHPVMSETYKQLRLKNESLLKDKENTLQTTIDTKEISKYHKQVPEIKQFEKATSHKTLESEHQDKSTDLRQDVEQYQISTNYEVGNLSSRRSTKSPIQLKDKLQNLYNEYINVKNKTSNPNILAGQIVSNKQFEDDEAQILSARRRLSSNKQMITKKGSDSRNSLGTPSSIAGKTSESVGKNSDDPYKVQLNESQTIKTNIQSQIRKLAETMRGQMGGNTNSYKSGYSSTITSTQQQSNVDYQSKVASNKYQPAHNNKGNEYQKYYEMPKKITTESQKRVVNQTIKPATVTSSTINHSSASIISEMHMQNGMNSIKKDLQRKIQNYQSILKKTYNDKRQVQQQPCAGSKAQPKSPFDYNKFTTLDSQNSQGELRQGSKLNQNSQASTIQQENSNSKSSRNTYQNKIENLQSLKSAFFSKIHSLNQKLEQEKVQAQQSRLSSRSKSPLQRNLPRQFTNSFKQSGQNAEKVNSIQRKNTMDYDESSDSDSDDLNMRRGDTGKAQYNKELTASVKDFKRARRQDVNFKSISRESMGQRQEETRKSYQQEKQEQDAMASPKPCVTYRGGATNGGGRSALLSSSQQQMNGLYTNKYKQC